MDASYLSPNDDSKEEEVSQSSEKNGIKVFVLNYSSEKDSPFNKITSEAQKKFVQAMAAASSKAEIGGRNIRPDMHFKMRGYLAEVDLARTDVLVSSNRNHPDKKSASEADKKNALAMCTTERWAEYNNTLLAVNANFYSLASGDAHTMPSTTTIGLSLSERIVDQKPLNSGEETNKPGCLNLLFDAENTAYLIERYVNNDSMSISREKTAVKVNDYVHGVAGIWLVKDGEIPVHSERHAPQRHARLAIGLKSEGEARKAAKIYIVMIELQTALRRDTEYPVGTFTSSSKLFDYIRREFFLGNKNQHFTNDDDLELDTSKQTLPPECQEIIEFINAKKSIGDSDLTADSCTISATVENEWIKPEEKAFTAPLEFSKRVEAQKKADNFALKITNRNGDIYIIRGIERAFRNGANDRDIRVFRKVSGKLPSVANSGAEDDDDADTFRSFPSKETDRTRGEDVSVGITLEEFGKLFLDLGINNAINLDGSGSSSFIYTPYEMVKTIEKQEQSFFSLKKPSQTTVNIAVQNSTGAIKNAYHDGRPAADDPTRQTSKMTRTKDKIGGTSQKPVFGEEYQAQEMYHLEEHLRPRPAANHIGFKPKK